MSKVMPITGALTAVILAVAPGVHAQVTSSQDSARSPWPTATRDPGFGSGAEADSTYIRQALRGNFTEVGLGRMAESRAEDDDVEEFAERMISEHGDMYEDWEALAQKIDLETEVELEQAQQPSVVRLRNLSGPQFDQAYMAEMIRLHEQDLVAFQRMGTSARSPEVRQLATSGASTVQEHLALARQVGSRVGVATTAGRAGGVTSPTPTRSDSARSDSARRRTTADRTTRTGSDDRDVRDDGRDRPPLPARDRPFVQEALGDHLMHIRLAKRAQREGKMEDTRELGEQIEKTLTRWRERWENVADRRDVEVPSNLERADRQRIERLDGASERGFDRTYATVVANHLERVVQNFRKKGPTAESAAVRGLVESELPVMRELLTDARQLEKRVSERREDSNRQ
jgi:putative membrane protein